MHLKQFVNEVGKGLKFKKKLVDTKHFRLSYMVDIWLGKHKRFGACRKRIPFLLY